MSQEKPKKGDTFTLGEGPCGKTCDVTKRKGTTVHYTDRRDGSEHFFELNSPTHQLVKWWG